MHPSTTLKSNHLDDMVWRLDYFDEDLFGLKKELQEYYRKGLMKSAGYASRITAELMATITPKGKYKRCIKELTNIIKWHSWKNIKVPFELYACSVVLAFPMVAEILKIVANFDKGKLFKAEDIMSELKSEYKIENIRVALHTMDSVCLIKSPKRSLYTVSHWPIINMLSMYGFLNVIKSIRSIDTALAEALVKAFSFKLTHQFVDAFPDLDYSSLVGNNLFESFLSSDATYSLQHNDEWVISNEPFIYKDLNIIESRVPKNYIVTVEEAVGIINEMRKT